MLRVGQSRVVAYRQLTDISNSYFAQTNTRESSRIARGARFCCAAPRGMRGFPDAAVACLGAGGGVLSPGTKSNMGRIFSSTLLRSASSLPSGRGIHVPDPVRPARLYHHLHSSNVPWYFPYPPCTFSCTPFCTSRSRIRVLLGLSYSATFNIWVALIQSSARRRIQ